MWKPRRLTTLWAFTTCYRNTSLIFLRRHKNQSASSSKQLHRVSLIIGTLPIAYTPVWRDDIVTGATVVRLLLLSGKLTTVCRCPCLLDVPFTHTKENRTKLPPRFENDVAQKSPKRTFNTSRTHRKQQATPTTKLHLICTHDEWTSVCNLQKNTPASILIVILTFKHFFTSKFF
jgi:hypothetical protein